MSRTRTAIVVSSFCLFALALIVPASANADLLVWDLLADCQAGNKEVKLKMHYSVAGYWKTDPIQASQKLYGCGGVCKTAGELSTTVDWKKTAHSCWCMPSGTAVASADQCPADNYAKCSETAEATLPYSCDELGYGKICVQQSCKSDFDWTGFAGGGPCAELKPAAAANQCMGGLQLVEAAKLVTDRADQIPVDDPNELDELGGCSVGTANASLLTLLLVVAGLSLLVSRKRHRK